MYKVVNIYHFSDLSPDMQEKLLDYIVEHFSKIKSIARGYGKSAMDLKRFFTHAYCTFETGHVTAECFMEAMVKSGYKAVMVNENATGDAKNWFFNAYAKRSYQISKP